MDLRNWHEFTEYALRIGKNENQSAAIHLRELKHVQRISGTSGSGGT